MTGRRWGDGVCDDGTCPEGHPRRTAPAPTGLLWWCACGPGANKIPGGDQYAEWMGWNEPSGIGSDGQPTRR